MFSHYFLVSPVLLYFSNYRYQKIWQKAIQKIFIKNIFIYQLFSWKL